MNIFVARSGQVGPSQRSILGAHGLPIGLFLPGRSAGNNRSMDPRPLLSTTALSTALILLEDLLTGPCRHRHRRHRLPLRTTRLLFRHRRHRHRRRLRRTAGLPSLTLPGATAQPRRLQEATARTLPGGLDRPTDHMGGMAMDRTSMDTASAEDHMEDHLATANHMDPLATLSLRRRLRPTVSLGCSPPAHRLRSDHRALVDRRHLPGLPRLRLRALLELRSCTRARVRPRHLGCM